MEQSEQELVGHPLDEVPQRDPDEDCNARRDDDGRFLGYCNRTSGWGTESDQGRCRTHGGDGGAPEGNKNAEGNDGGAAPEGNENALTHGAYAEHAKKPLIEGEKEAMEEAEQKLENPSNAKEIARTAATYCLMMGHRSQDPRWFRRFEGICDKFAIAPEEVVHAEVEVDGEVDHNHSHDHDLDDNTKDVLDKMTGGG